MISAYAAVLAADQEPNTFLVLVLMGIGGILVGGAWSVRKKSTVLAAMMGITGLVAVVAGILQQVPS